MFVYIAFSPSPLLHNFFFLLLFQFRLSFVDFELGAHVGPKVLRKTRTVHDAHIHRSFLMRVTRVRVISIVVLNWMEIFQRYSHKRMWYRWRYRQSTYVSAFADSYRLHLFFLRLCAKLGRFTSDCESSADTRYLLKWMWIWWNKKKTQNAKFSNCLIDWQR